jgi:hypothetical protein
MQMLTPYMHNFASPSTVHIFLNAIQRLIVITPTPNVTHAMGGVLVRQFPVREESLRKHAGGKMKASAVAETPPVISSITPRSHVIRDTRKEVRRGEGIGEAEGTD